MRKYRYMLMLAIALAASGVASLHGIAADDGAFFSQYSGLPMLPYVHRGVR